MIGESYSRFFLKAIQLTTFFEINVTKIMLATETLRGILRRHRTKKLTAEVCAGIEFVQVSSLSSSQRKLFWRSPASNKIITILRGKELLYGCLLYKDYCDWYINLEK